MAEVRKSEFTGDIFGDWVVTGRAPAQNRKRAWFVSDGTEQKVVLQVDLPLLGKQTAGEKPESPWDGGVSHSPDVNPFDLVFTGSFFVDDPDSPPLDEHDEPTIGSSPLKAGPGDCKHGVQILECPECEPLVGPQGREALTKYPQRYKGSAEITASVLASNALAREAAASVALDKDPEGGTYVIADAYAEITESDWTSGLEVQTPVLIGEFTPETLTEAQLDAAVPPQDPMRAAIRKLMGQIFDYRNEMQSVHAQLTVAHDNLAAVMDSVDEIMKAAVTR